MPMLPAVSNNTLTACLSHHRHSRCRSSPASRIYMADRITSAGCTQSSHICRSRNARRQRPTCTPRQDTDIAKQPIRNSTGP